MCSVTQVPNQKSKTYGKVYASICAEKIVLPHPDGARTRVLLKKSYTEIATVISYLLNRKMFHHCLNNWTGKMKINGCLDHVVVFNIHAKHTPKLYKRIWNIFCS